MNTQLDGVVVCVAGDLPADADDRQWTDENIKRWLELRGGKFVDVMDDSVTHLLCSRRARRAKKEKVKYALHSKKCYIVTYEWLDDTILLYDQCKRKRAPPHLYNPKRDRPNKEISALYRKRKRPVVKLGAVADVSSPGKNKDEATYTKKETEHPAMLKKRQGPDAADNGREGDTKPTDGQRSLLMQQRPRTADDEKCQLVRIPHTLAHALAHDGQEPASSLKRRRGDTVDPQLVKAARLSHKKTAAFDDLDSVRAARP